VVGNSEDALIKNTTFSFIVAERKGGAVYCASTGRVTLVVDSIFPNSNSAMFGGFAYLSACTLSIAGSGSEIRSNKAQIGGAIYAHDSSIILFSSFSTIKIVKNKADYSFEGMKGHIHPHKADYSFRSRWKPSAIHYYCPLSSNRGRVSQGRSKENDTE
jgi:hypothetical protein